MTPVEESGIEEVLDYLVAGKGSWTWGPAAGCAEVTLPLADWRDLARAQVLLGEQAAAWANRVAELEDALRATPKQQGGRMTEDELRQLEALTSEATPGPWVVSNGTRGFPVGHTIFQFSQKGRTIAATSVMHDGTREDAAFIAACREAMPKLLAEVRAWRSIQLAASGEQP